MDMRENNMKDSWTIGRGRYKTDVRTNRRVASGQSERTNSSVNERTTKGYLVGFASVYLPMSLYRLP